MSTSTDTRTPAMTLAKQVAADLDEAGYHDVGRPSREDYVAGPITDVDGFEGTLSLHVSFAAALPAEAASVLVTHYLPDSTRGFLFNRIMPAVDVAAFISGVVATLRAQAS